MRIETKQESQKFWFKLKLSIAIVVSWWFVFFIENIFSLNLYSYGNQPHNLDNIIGIFTYPFLHGGFEHLANNSLSGFMLFSALFLVYEKYSLKVLLIIYIFSGSILWVIGDSGSTHVGASSVIYGVAFFIFFRGIIIRKSSQIALSLFVTVWYGSMVWGINPFTVEQGVSWQGHLSGAIVGVFLAFFLKKDFYFDGNEYFEEDRQEDLPFFDKHPLD